MYELRLIDNEDFIRNGKPKYFALLEIYAIADRLMIESLCNAIIDRMAQLLKKTNCVLTPSDTFIMYEKIRHNAGVRSLFLDIFTLKKTDKLIETHRDEWHQEFLRDLICKIKRPMFTPAKCHSFQPWRPPSWLSTRPCVNCDRNLNPTDWGSLCAACSYVLCSECSAIVSNDFRIPHILTKFSCPPWAKGTCNYHEHISTKKCT